MFSIIACVGKNREIGKNGQLIYHLKNDMAFFKKTTSNHPVAMGRKTWESLNGKLQNRQNIVFSRSDFEGPDLIIHNIDRFISENQNTNEEIFIIGGAKIYQKFIDVAKTLFLTEVDATKPDADAYFPDFNQSDFTQKLIEKGTENNLNYQIIKYNRK
ncbi:dihydrofolate reductase [Candidatus Saccharibacteria bacterium]|nr:dihydrofolate reductase [Candidatus Saccharibacteria bacterium]